MAEFMESTGPAFKEPVMEEENDRYTWRMAADFCIFLASSFAFAFAHM